MLALWPHMIYWVLFDKYCEKPVVADPDSKPRVQINPCTWSGAPGEGQSGGYLGAKQYGQREPVLPPSPASNGPADSFGSKISTTDHALWVQDPRTWLKDAGPAASHGNLHPVDIGFWFFNVRANVQARIEAFVRQ